MHCAVLEPDVFEREYIAAPKFDLRTNNGKAEKSTFAEANADKCIIEIDDYLRCKHIAFNVRTIAGDLLRNGKAEQSFFADDDGLTVKCRPDYYIESAGVVVDLKTIEDISEYGIKKAIANYRYDRQDAHYLRTLYLAGKKAKTFLFIFAESNPPHMVKIREIEHQARVDADNEIEILLDKYRAYLRTNETDTIKYITPWKQNNEY